jgi:hypothetical protein
MSVHSSRIILLRATAQLEKPIATETRLLPNWTKTVAVVLLMALMAFLLLPPGTALADDPSASADSSDGTGIQVASWALTVPYIIGKGAFALGGAVVGGLGYVFSGGNFDTAKNVWTRSIYGTYVIRPAHLRGEEPVHFLGKAEESQVEATPPPANPAPEPVKPEKK